MHPEDREEIVLPVRRRPDGGITPLSELPLSDLVGELTSKASLLVQQEVELAKTELRADLKAEAQTAQGLGIAAMCGLIALNLVFVAIALALALVMPAWLAALVVAAAVAVVGGIAGLAGWKRRVSRPLERTRKTLKEDYRWARERIS